MRAFSTAICVSCCFLLSAVAPADGQAVAPAGATPAGKGDFNVRDFGAAGDGKTLDSPAINKAIDAAAQAGGGTVLLPAGTYLSGSIRLKSNIHLRIDAGATILGRPEDRKAYDPAERFEGHAYQDGGHTYFHNSLIWGEGLTNVSITGPGMINGGGLVRNSNQANKSIALKLCRNVLLRDFTIYHGGWFAVLVTGCDNMTVDNLTMDTNRDGIDIDCCRNVMVSNCRINSPGDDGICPKSTFALGRNVITENLTIVNCMVSGFKEGSLLDGTMKPRGQRPHQVRHGIQRRFSQRHHRQLRVSRLQRAGDRRGGRRHPGEHHHQQYFHDGRGVVSHLHHHRQTQPRPGSYGPQPHAETS